MSELPVFHIGHHKHQPIQSLKIEWSDGYPDKDLESAQLHRHNFYMVSLFLKGGGEHIIDFEKFEIKPNRLFFLIPGQIHLLKTDRSAKFFTVQFTDDFILFYGLNQPANDHYPFIFPFNYLNCYLDVSEEKANELVHLFKHLRTEKSAATSNDIVIANYLNILLEKIKVESGPQKNSFKTMNAVIRNYLKLIEMDYKKNLSVKDYARELHVSANYLNILAKKETGYSASSHIKNRLMLEAKRLVVHSNLTVSQIAHELNFCDTSYFIKIFKGKTGLTPGGFKSQYYKMLYD